MQDEYEDVFESINPALIYTRENLPTAGLLDGFQEEYYGCRCINCCNEQCPCRRKTGAMFNRRKLYKINEQPIFECNSNCDCQKDCGLRCVQLGPIRGLTVKSTNDRRGYGLFSEIEIHKDSFICEYAGELLIEPEAERRYSQYKIDGKMNYIFWIKEHFGAKTNTTIIDPTAIGNIGRFINHSCAPNCYFVLVRVNNCFPKLCIISKRDLGAGEEITMDYGANEYGVRAGDANNRIDCLCGSKECKGFLPSHQV